MALTFITNTVAIMDTVTTIALLSRGRTAPRKVGWSWHC